MPSFRISKKPSRTCTKIYKNYRDYKKYIKRDFNDRCGYCDAWDGWFGGTNYYHIDHFAPQKKFVEFKSVYKNLVYSCPYCNIAKGDDWVTDDHTKSHNGEIGYIDPCKIEYDQLFYRLENGEIKAHTSIGEYIYQRLHFYLARHRVIWNLTRLYIRCNKIMSMLNDPDTKPEYRKELDEIYSELSKYIHKYLRQHLGEFE
jgi:hypothetical protein